MKYFFILAFILLIMGAANTRETREAFGANNSAASLKSSYMTPEELALQRKNDQDIAESKRIAYENSEEGQKEKARSSLTIDKFNWHKGGFKSVMIANFHFKNTGKRAVKDIKILCTGYANSGTVIDNNISTVFELVKPGKTKKVEVNMGFIRSQVASTSCSIIDFDLV